MVDGELIGKFRFIVLLTSMRHSEPVTDVTGVGIRFSKRITDCHNQSADWFRNDAFREGCAKTNSSINRNLLTQATEKGESDVAFPLVFLP